MIMEHRRRMQNSFRQQADRFESPTLTLSRRDYLQWMVETIPRSPDTLVLDVAAGTGHLSRALASTVQRVIAVDATPEMIRQGREEMTRAGLTNLTFVQGLAETLPFPDNRFDLVTCRFAVHHFETPGPPVKEMVRVCRPGGTIAVIDLVAPADTTLAARYNRLERLRDPSHTRALTLAELQQLLTEAGVHLSRAASRPIEVNAVTWLDLTNPDIETRRVILGELIAEINGAPRSTGMSPFWQEEELMFLQTWAIVAGVKSQGLTL